MARDAVGSAQAVQRQDFCGSFKASKPNILNLGYVLIQILTFLETDLIMKVT